MGLSKYFTTQELTEIKTYKLEKLSALPEDLVSYLNVYESLQCTSDIQKFAFSHYNDPKDEFEKKWIQESFINASKPFIYRNQLSLNDYSEADLLHKLWLFVYNLYDDELIQAKLGERSSIAVSLGRNENRTIPCVEKRPRKAKGSKLDILFKYGSVEVGTCEVGKNDVVPVDNKYLDDGRMKLPKTLRDMFACLVQKSPENINNITTVGYLIMGNI